jgi:hypothetical protein
MTPLRLRTPVRDLASRCAAAGAATAGRERAVRWTVIESAPETGRSNF